MPGPPSPNFSAARDACVAANYADARGDELTALVNSLPGPAVTRAQVQQRAKILGVRQDRGPRGALPGPAAPELRRIARAAAADDWAVRTPADAREYNEWRREMGARPIQVTA